MLKRAFLAALVVVTVGCGSQEPRPTPEETSGVEPSKDAGLDGDSNVVEVGGQYGSDKAKDGEKNDDNDVADVGTADGTDGQATDGEKNTCGPNALCGGPCAQFRAKEWLDSGASYYCNIVGGGEASCGLKFDPQGGKCWLKCMPAFDWSRAKKTTEGEKAWDFLIVTSGNQDVKCKK